MTLKTRVLLVDDHTLFREGLAGLLSSQPDIEVVGEAEDGLEVLVKARELQPDLILMDVTMPGCDGLEATQLIKDIKTFGCGAAIATTSMVTELVRGRTIEEALQVTNRDVADALGGLPPIKMHCSLLAEEAIKAAVEDYRERLEMERDGKQDG